MEQSASICNQDDISISILHFGISLLMTSGLNVTSQKVGIISQVSAFYRIIVWTFLQENVHRNFKFGPIKKPFSGTGD
jgi:hypothetical protein